MSPVRHHHPTRSTEAFTLVEVLLAATMLLVGTIGMMHALTSGAEMLDTSRKQTIATQIMHGEIERLRVTDWPKLAADMQSYSYPMQKIEQGYAESSDSRVVKWNSSAVSSSAFKCSRTLQYTSADKTQVAVAYSVNWTGNTGRSYTRTTSTFVGKNGLYVAYQR